MKPESLLEMAMAMGGNDIFGASVKKAERDWRKAENPHNFQRFETDGFVSFSVTEDAHKAKYNKYLKRKK